MIEIIKQRLETYQRDSITGAGAMEQENALKEILQNIALYALWRADFFEVALFQGGTSLRILHGLPRFSEDLDFMLRAPDDGFEWARYLAPLQETFEKFGLALTASSKDQMDKRIRAALIKDDSIANQLDLSFNDQGRARAIKIKLEIDVKPPPFSGEATTFLDFPLDHEVRHQDLASNFALKIHALLCRGFLKGRDWYDFGWYVAKGISPNLAHLQAALRQYGPWSDQDKLVIDASWIKAALGAAIAKIDWAEAADDVRRFLRATEAKSLDLWGERFFMAKLDKLLTTINP
jgi:predicted nucleotidyltransferase component of viral defense system